MGILRQRRNFDSAGDSTTAKIASGEFRLDICRNRRYYDILRCQTRFRPFVRWAARILLLVAFLLSRAKIVQVGSSSTAQLKKLSLESHARPNSTLLLIIAHARPHYLERSLASVIRYHPGDFDKWPIAVSIDRQDGHGHVDVERVALNAQTQLSGPPGLQIWSHDVSYTDDDEDLVKNDLIDVVAYRRIARHYKWALNQTFSAVDGLEIGHAYDRVVILEDDMEIAVDFFEYFDALAPLLDSDPSLLCVSAWSDNGKAHLVSDPKQLHRTDFFPGLGWMLTRRIWDELKMEWPKQYWDDWLRAPRQTRGRQCIRPEISRTINFGSDGASQAHEFEKHVSKVVLNSEPVNFSALNLDYLRFSDYEQLVFSRMSNSVLLKYSNYLTTRPQNSDVIARYPRGNIAAIGKRTGIMTDHRNGIYRTSFQGIIVIPWNGHWAFLVDKDWKPPEKYSLGSTLCCNGYELIA